MTVIAHFYWHLLEHHHCHLSFVAFFARPQQCLLFNDRDLFFAVRTLCFLYSARIYYHSTALWAINVPFILQVRLSGQLQFTIGVFDYEFDDGILHYILNLIIKLPRLFVSIYNTLISQQFLLLVLPPIRMVDTNEPRSQRTEGVSDQFNKYLDLTPSETSVKTCSWGSVIIDSHIHSSYLQLLIAHGKQMVSCVKSDRFGCRRIDLATTFEYKLHFSIQICKPLHLSDLTCTVYLIQNLPYYQWLNTSQAIVTYLRLCSTKMYQLNNSCYTLNTSRDTNLISSDCGFFSSFQILLFIFFRCVSFKINQLPLMVAGLDIEVTKVYTLIVGYLLTTKDFQVLVQAVFFISKIFSGRNTVEFVIIVIVELRFESIIEDFDGESFLQTVCFYYSFRLQKDLVLQSFLSSGVTTLIIFGSRSQEWKMLLGKFQSVLGNLFLVSCMMCLPNANSISIIPKAHKSPLILTLSWVISSGALYQTLPLLYQVTPVLFFPNCEQIPRSMILISKFSSIRILFRHRSRWTIFLCLRYFNADLIWLQTLIMAGVSIRPMYFYRSPLQRQSIMMCRCYCFFFTSNSSLSELIHQLCAFTICLCSSSTSNLASFKKFYLSYFSYSGGNSITFSAKNLTGFFSSLTKQTLPQPPLPIILIIWYLSRNLSYSLVCIDNP